MDAKSAVKLCSPSPYWNLLVFCLYFASDSNYIQNGFSHLY